MRYRRAARLNSLAIEDDYFYNDGIHRETMTFAY